MLPKSSNGLRPCLSNCLLKLDLKVSFKYKKFLSIKQEFCHWTSFSTLLRHCAYRFMSNVREGIEIKIKVNEKSVFYPSSQIISSVYPSFVGEQTIG